MRAGTKSVLVPPVVLPEPSTGGVRLWCWEKLSPKPKWLVTSVSFSLMLHAHCGSAGALLYTGSLWAPVRWSNLNLAGTRSDLTRVCLATSTKAGAPWSRLSGIVLRSWQRLGISPKTQLSGNATDFFFRIVVIHYTCFLYPNIKADSYRV